MPDVVKKQTIKQAKASYKSRGRPSLSEKEQRQLERALELEQRAERAKEAEKRRAEAAKKKADFEKKQQSEKQRLQLGSQRRYDRFGYKSSQFHLGAFFGQKPAMKPIQAVQEETEDGFDDDDLDDDSLLEALDKPNNQKTPQNLPAERHKDDTLMPPPPPPAFTTVHHARSVPVSRTDEDLSGFFDELGSSTQIARELNNEDDDDEFGEPPDFRHVSFSSGSLDLTEEDLEMLDPPQAEASEGAPRQELAVPTPTVRPDTMTIHDSSKTAIPQQVLPAQPKAQIDTSRGQGRMPPPTTRKQQNMQPRPLSIAQQATRTMAETSCAPARKAMPPPPRPLQAGPHTRSVNAAKSNLSQQMLPPPLPRTTSAYKPAQTTDVKQPQQQPLPPTGHRRKPPGQQSSNAAPSRVHDTASSKRPPQPIRGPFLPASSLYCSPDLGFTMTQLESLVDDDLQLTQVA